MEKDYLFLLKLAQSHTEPHSSGHQFFSFTAIALAKLLTFLNVPLLFTLFYRTVP